jgi:hypothetical protein
MRAGSSQSKLALCFIAALTLAGLGSGTAGAATIKLIGSESKTGSFAAVSITKDAKRPHAMYYKVIGAPAGLTVDVQTLIHCTRGSKTKAEGPAPGQDDEQQARQGPRDALQPVHLHDLRRGGLPRRRRHEAHREALQELSAPAQA